SFAVMPVFQSSSRDRPQSPLGGPASKGVAMMSRHFWRAALLVLASAASAFAQGTQTATLSGTVLSSDKQPLPGVTVSVKSPALLGVRTAVTDTNGGYIFKGLPSG